MSITLPFQFQGYANTSTWPQDGFPTHHLEGRHFELGHSVYVVLQSKEQDDAASVVQECNFVIIFFCGIYSYSSCSASVLILVYVYVSRSIAYMRFKWR